MKMSRKQIVGGILLLGIGVFIFTTRKAQVPIKVERLNNQILVGDSSHIDSFAKDLKDLDVYWSHIHKAREHFEANNFDDAAKEYQQAIKTARSDGDVWMARSLLAKLYEKNGQYSLALQEIAWLEEHNKRQDVLAELTKDKHRISELLTEGEPTPENKAD